MTRPGPSGGVEPPVDYIQGSSGRAPRVQPGSAHHRDVCRHGRVISQCRCPGPKVERVVACSTWKPCPDDADVVHPAGEATPVRTVTT